MKQMTPKSLRKIVKKASKRVDKFTPRELELAKQSGLWYHGKGAK